MPNIVYIHSGEPCSSPPACRWQGWGLPGSDPIRFQRSGSSFAAGEPPPRSKCEYNGREILNHVRLQCASVNKLTVVNFAVCYNKCMRKGKVWQCVVHGAWSSAYLLGAGVGIACLLLADESALQSSVLVDFHRLHLLLDGIHGGWFCVLLLQTRKKLQDQVELEIMVRNCKPCCTPKSVNKTIENNAIISRKWNLLYFIIIWFDLLDFYYSLSWLKKLKLSSFSRFIAIQLLKLLIIQFK